jgi:uncharacterized caspase-like protein
MTSHRARRFLRIALAFSLALFAAAASAQPQDADGNGRVALVIGNAAYPARPLVTSVNDAGLVAEMVRNAGYDLVEARDVDEALLRQTVRDFLDKVAAAGPDAVAFVYLSGYGLQFEGENYFAPVSARLARVSDIPTETFRVGDLLRALAGMNVAARIVVLDMGRAHPFFGGARAVAPGLAVAEPGEGALVAFSTGPGEVMREGAGPYGLYAPALVEMVTKPGLPLDQVFTQVRLRVHEASRGAITPWHRSRITAPVFFFEGEATADDAPPPQAGLDPQAQQLLGRPLGSLPPDQAYSVVLERDTIDAYQEFLAAFPNHPLTKRVRLLLAERREALIWRRTVTTNTPQAYWSYLRRYPRGPHAPEAHRRLAALTAPAEPPADFAMLDYGVPPPPDDEVEFYEDYYGTYYGDEPRDYAPPPPFPAYLLPPLEQGFVDLPPPVYYEGAAYLPVPGPIVIRRAIRPARPVFIFRDRTQGPRRDWRRPEAINRFGGQAPRGFRRDGPRTTPLVQPGGGALPTDQGPQRRLIEQRERERLQQKDQQRGNQQRLIEQRERERALQERQKQDQQQRLNQQQRERALQEKQNQDQQQRGRLLQEKQKQDQQQRGNQQQDRERAFREKQKQDQQRSGQQQQQQRLIEQQQRERASQGQRQQQQLQQQQQQQRAIQQQQQQQQQQRAIQQQQQQQQRAIQQQQQQQQRTIQQQQQQQPRAQPQPARPQPTRPQCPRGVKPDGTCR